MIQIKRGIQIFSRSNEKIFFFHIKLSFLNEIQKKMKIRKKCAPRKKNDFTRSFQSQFDLMCFGFICAVSPPIN
jgi:hypothetical protein